MTFRGASLRAHEVARDGKKRRRASRSDQQEAFGAGERRQPANLRNGQRDAGVADKIIQLIRRRSPAAF
jgi:hypothetical protein